MNIPKELQELRANTEELVKKYKEVRAAMPSDVSPGPDNRMQDMEDMMFRMVSYIHSRINNLEDGFYNWASEHMTNHLPNPSTPSDMQAALDNLGLAKDYDVKKRTIYANINGGKGILLDIEQ